MAIKVKELKDDALIDVKVNKNYYLMVKAASFALLQSLNIQEKEDDYLKEMLSKGYENLDTTQQAFYTVTLLLAEIERQATQNMLYIEKDVLEPGDEGYVAPTQD